MPLASVIIPTYNRSDLVVRAINSVTSQTLQDLEILVINDGSTDDTQDVISTYNDPRIHYFCKENGGVSSARNLGIDNAKGDLVFFLDDDDEWYDNHLSTMVQTLKENPEYGVVYCPWGEKDCSIDSLDTNKPSGAITPTLFKRGIVHIIGCGIRRTVLDGIRFDRSLKIAEDSDFLLRLSLKTHFKFTTETYAICNKTEVSLTSNFDESRLLSLERFYFKLGVNTVIPENIALKKFSKSCRRIAKYYAKKRNISAANYYYCKAIRYCPGDLRNYLPFLLTAAQAMLSSSTWEPPKALPDTICSD